MDATLRFLNTQTFGVLGSSGDFGSFVVERIREGFPEAQIRTFDSAGGSNSTEQEVVSSNIVIPAVPPMALEETIARLAPKMKSRSTIVEVTSVKMHPQSVMRRLVPSHVQYVLTHPLFGRQSFVDNGNNMAGLELAWCGGSMSLHTGAMLHGLFTKLGLRVVRMTAEEHDRGPSIEQLITMYQGLVMKEAGFELNKHQLHTRSAQHFFRAMYIVRNDEALFRQIAKLNPFWPEEKKRLEAAYHRIFEENGH